MLGLTQKLFKTIHALRLTELQSAKAFRQIEVVTAFFGNYGYLQFIFVKITNKNYSFST